MSETWTSSTITTAKQSFLNQKQRIDDDNYAFSDDEPSLDSILGDAIGNNEDTAAVTKLMDGLFFSGVDASQDREFLQAHKISAIVNCAAISCPEAMKFYGFRYLSLRWETNSQYISQAFDMQGRTVQRIFKFIEQARIRGEGVLIHSIDGKNRAACASISYLMRKFQWSLVKCLEFVRQKRADIAPSTILLRQLTKSMQYLNKNLVDGSNHGYMQTNDESDAASTFESRWINVQCHSALEQLVTNTFLNFAPSSQLVEHSKKVRKPNKTRCLGWTDLKGVGKLTRPAGSAYSDSCQTALKIDPMESYDDQETESYNATRVSSISSPGSLSSPSTDNNCSNGLSPFHVSTDLLKSVYDIATDSTDSSPEHSPRTTATTASTTSLNPSKCIVSSFFMSSSELSCTSSALSSSLLMPQQRQLSVRASDGGGEDSFSSPNRVQYTNSSSMTSTTSSAYNFPVRHIDESSTDYVQDPDEQSLPMTVSETCLSPSQSLRAKNSRNSIHGWTDDAATFSMPSSISCLTTNTVLSLSNSGPASLKPTIISSYSNLSKVSAATVQNGISKPDRIKRVGGDQVTSKHSHPQNDELLGFPLTTHANSEGIAHESNFSSVLPSAPISPSVKHLRANKDIDSVRRQSFTPDDRAANSSNAPFCIRNHGLSVNSRQLSIGSSTASSHPGVSASQPLSIFQAQLSGSRPAPISSFFDAYAQNFNTRHTASSAYSAAKLSSTQNSANLHISQSAGQYVFMNELAGPSLMQRQVTPDSLSKQQVRASKPPVVKPKRAASARQHSAFSSTHKQKQVHAGIPRLMQSTVASRAKLSELYKNCITSS